MNSTLLLIIGLLGVILSVVGGSMILVKKSRNKKFLIDIWVVFAIIGIILVTATTYLSNNEAFEIPSPEITLNFNLSEYNGWQYHALDIPPTEESFIQHAFTKELSPEEREEIGLGTIYAGHSVSQETLLELYRRKNQNEDLVSSNVTFFYEGENLSALTWDSKERMEWKSFQTFIPVADKSFIFVMMLSREENFEENMEDLEQILSNTETVESKQTSNSVEPYKPRTKATRF